jgi:hypothetical protein
VGKDGDSSGRRGAIQSIRPSTAGTDRPVRSPVLVKREEAWTVVSRGARQYLVHYLILHSLLVGHVQVFLSARNKNSTQHFVPVAAWPI